MSIFNQYARYYDLLYRDKDYRGESDYVHALIQEAAPKAQSVLNLGCGSGRHDRHLVDLGYRVTGVDISAEMLAAAREGAAGDDRLRYSQGDVRSLHLEESFDVVVSLFHVMSYQVTNEDLLAAMSTALLHLKPGGVFIFDCWYGPGVLTDRPSVRVKELEDDSIRVTRIAVPAMHADRDLVEVDFLVFIKNLADGSISELREKHLMRYLFTPGLRDQLTATGFEPLCFKEWLSSAQLGYTSWNAVVTARKPY
ncbi:class I SAM-dependent DNA methyltransferase [Citrifermentans bremense]|uniref:class I SAM-dependent DNA methyltransferase n=1 Tax=Citrifermentans bremense TaxID=60035 RepID=UPI000423CBFC|nr:class I SAM-dependent methyltransferase [Citrifermentans bremense]